MSAFRPAWCLCGGWAVDAWLGRQTRDHPDVDIAVSDADQRALFDHLSGWQLIAHDAEVEGNTSEPWDGRDLALPAHIHARPGDAGRLPERLDSPAQEGFGLDIQLTERDGDFWVLRREPRVSMPVRECIRASGWGLPALVPEAVLFFKAGETRPHDESDFRTLLPGLTDKQRRWLREAVSRAQTDHSWLPQL